MQNDCRLVVDCSPRTLKVAIPSSVERKGRLGRERWGVVGWGHVDFRVVWLGELARGSLGKDIDVSVVNHVAGRHFCRHFTPPPPELGGR